MKKINKYLFGAFAALLSAGLFSCVEEAPEYVAGEPDQAGCYGIYFPTQEASGDHTFDPTMDKVITVTVSRDSLKAAANPLPEITVPISYTASAEGIFEVPENVTFADGQQEATFNVTFPKAETAVKYDLSLSIDDKKFASLYNNAPTFLTTSVFCVEWKYFMKENSDSEKALFTFVQDWWGEVHQFYLKYYEVEGIRHCVTESLPAEVEHEDGTVETVYGIWGTGAEYEMEFLWYTKTNYISIPYQSMGFNNNGDIIHACSEDGFYEKYRGADYYTSRGYANTLDWLVKNYPDEVSFYDGHGGLNLFMYYVCDQDGDKYGRGYKFGINEMAIANGYVRVDYSIDVEAYETEDGVAPVAFSVGPDVTSVKYVIAEGELDAKEAGKLVTSITEAKAENVQTIVMESTDTIVGVSPAASGIYTVVAVSYADKDAKESAFTSFTYVAAEDKEEYAAVVTVATEPTSAMYEHVGLNAVNSFGYFVYGKDLTEVKVGVFKTADVQAKGAEALAASIKTALSDSIVNIINGTGYATLATGLDALTAYSVVVYASNGYNHTVATAEYTTDGLPNEPTGLTGTFTYAQFWEGDDPGLALLVNPNYANTYAINNWGGGIDMNFTWDKETNACHVNDQFTGYTHSTYGDVYVIELADYTGSTDEGVSYYDPETQTFHFFVVYYVSAGYFGKGEEVFTLSDAAGANGRRLADSQLTKAQGGNNHDFVLERNPQTVAFKAVAVERPARSSRFSAPVKVDSMLKF